MRRITQKPTTYRVNRDVTPCYQSAPQPSLVVKAAYNIHEAAESLSISRSTLYELIEDGRLDTVLIGRRRLVPVTAIEKLLTALSEPKS